MHITWHILWIRVLGSDVAGTIEKIGYSTGVGLGLIVDEADDFGNGRSLSRT
jgi:hypothetical protein